MFLHVTILYFIRWTYIYDFILIFIINFDFYTDSYIWKFI